MTDPLKPTGDNTNVEQIAEFDGHTFYILNANPLYCNTRFFYYLSKYEQISTLSIPNDYFLAVADQLEAIDGKRFDKDKGTIVNLIRFAVGNRSLAWYHTTIAMIEAFVLVDDESILEISNKHNKIKRDTFINNPEARFFFSNLAANYLKSLPTDLKATVLEDYLTKTSNLQPELIESIMSHLTSEPFGIVTGKKKAE